jgi:hypothetical protein
MTSRLEQISDFVMLFSHKENQGKWIDVLALVDAARRYLSEWDRPLPDHASRCRCREAMQIAIAKLDEEQP